MPKIITIAVPDDAPARTIKDLAEALDHAATYARLSAVDCPMPEYPAAYTGSARYSWRLVGHLLRLAQIETATPVPLDAEPLGPVEVGPALVPLALTAGPCRPFPGDRRWQ